MKNLIIISIAMGLNLFSQSAIAQEQATPLPAKDLPPKEVTKSETNPEPSADAPIVHEDKFAAIVQFAKGKTKQDFKDIILFNETIAVPKNSYLKIITQKRCVAVIYENSEIRSPANKTSSWEVVKGAVRWICPEDKIERLVYKDTELQVQNGELLLVNNELTVVRDSVRFNNKDLKTQTIYKLVKTKWLQLRTQPDPYFIWKKNNEYNPPVESSLHSLEKPDDPYVTRISLNIAPVGMSGVYHHGWESKLSEHNLQTHAFRLGVNFPVKRKSYYVFLEHGVGEMNNNYENMMPIGARDLKFEATTLAVGIRHSHIKSSSFYYYGGFTRQLFRFHTHPQAGNFYDGEVVYPYNLSVGGGYQKIFFAKSWISLMVGFDLKIIQTLSVGKTKSFHQPWPHNSDPRGGMTQYMSFVYLGPVFNF